MSLAYALLGLLEPQPRHGYELKRLYDTHFGPAHPVRFGQIYATLARLRRDGMADIHAVETGSGPDRKVYVVTPQGVSDLERWLVEPQAPGMAGRGDLFTKVVLALLSGRAAEQILDVQRAEHLRHMRELTNRKRGGDALEQLACDFELLQLEADLRWIELAGKRVQRLERGSVERERRT